MAPVACIQTARLLYELPLRNAACSCFILANPIQQIPPGLTHPKQTPQSPDRSYLIPILPTRLCALCFNPTRSKLILTGTILSVQIIVLANPMQCYSSLQASSFFHLNIPIVLPRSSIFLSVLLLPGWPKSTLFTPNYRCWVKSAPPKKPSWIGQIWTVLKPFGSQVHIERSW